MQVTNDVLTSPVHVRLAGEAIYDLMHFRIARGILDAEELTEALVEVDQGPVIIGATMTGFLGSDPTLSPLDSSRPVILNDTVVDEVTFDTGVLLATTLDQVDISSYHHNTIITLLEPDEGLTYTYQQPIGGGNVFSPLRTAPAIVEAHPPTDHPTEAAATSLIDERTGDLVGQELADPRWDFRTIPGIATSLGWSEQEVEDALDAQPEIVRWIPARDDEGHQLMTSAEREVTGRERIMRLRAFLAKSTF
jgi:hypothetical protein